MLRVLRTGGLGEGLGEELKLTHRSEIDSSDFTCLCVWLAQVALTGFLLSISLNRVI